MASHETSLLTVQEAAEYLNCTVRYVQRTLRYLIPIVRLGARIYFERRDLDAFVASRREVPAR